MQQKDSKQISGRQNYITVAIFIFLAILILAAICLIWIVLHASIEGKTADIYQNGILLKSVSLTSAKEPYSFTVTGENGCFNEITVKEGCIGITAASCPDKLCVHQGYISSSLLPITCLPNRLVIRVREADATEYFEENSIVPDIMAY